MYARILISSTVFASLMLAATTLADPAGTAFSFQGQVKKDGQPLTGQADFRFTLWDHPVNVGGSPATLEVPGVEVINGLFTVQLDFGSSPFSEARWLGIEARHPSGGGTYEELAPRQPITGAPFALYALDAPGGAESFWAANGNNIHKTNSGNVGVNTTTPSYPLHVLGSVVAETSNIPIRGLKQGTGTFPGVHGETESASNDASGTRGYINNTAPGTRAAGVWGRNFGLTTNGYGIRGTHDGAGAGIFGESADPSGFGGYFQGRGYFSGNLGLGVTNPTYPLHIAPNGNGDSMLSSGTVRIGKASGEPGPGLRVSRSFGTGPIFTSQSLEIDGSALDAYSLFGGASVSINPNSSGNVFLVNGGGRVGIGTTTLPTGVKLAVRGKVLAEELEVQLFANWPDYVFDDDYELMPLSELEEKIRKNRHLPGIPPANEVEANGLAVGAMQVKLMEKVEELTLYVIQINKELDEVKGRNAALEAKLASLNGGQDAR